MDTASLDPVEPGKDGATVLHAAFTPVWTGNPYHRELARALARECVQVEAIDQLKDFYEEFRAGRRPLHILHLHALPWFKLRPLHFARYCAFLARIIRLRRYGVRVVWTIHDYRNHDTYYWRIEHLIGKFLARRVDALVVHGATARRIVTEGWGPEIAEKIHVIPHGNYIEDYPNTIGRSEARKRLGLGDGQQVFLFLGLIRPYKGVHRLVHAFKELAGSDARLIVAGRPLDDTIGPEVEAAIGGDSRISYKPGHVADGDVQLYMNACDVVVLPYGRVFTSGAAILAMSFGKACIAPRAGCVVDVLDSDGAVIFDPETDGDFKRAVSEVLNGKHDLAGMGRHNLEKAMAWSWRSVGAQTAALYRSWFGGSAASIRS